MLISAAKTVLSLTFLFAGVEVNTLDGEAVTGELQSLDATSALLSTSTGEVIVAAENLLQIRFNEPSAAEKPGTLEVALADGSVIPSESITASAASVELNSKMLGSVPVNRATVRAVRLQPANEDWAPAWQAFLERENEEDLLIVVKRDGSGLDFLSGVVSTIGAEEIVFLLDGDEIPVPLERVFGVVFPESEQKRQVAAAVTVRFPDGSSLRFGSVEMTEETLRGQTSWGREVSLPLANVAEIDFSAGRLHYLSDLEPITERYFGLDPPGREWGDLFSEDLETRDGLSSLWRMSRDRFANNGHPPLSLRGKTYRKGLCIFPKALIEYALDGRYSDLKAVVGVDDDVAFNQRRGFPPTAVELVIEADGQEVFRKLVKAPDAAIPLNLDLKGVSTLSISVDFGDGSSTCDYLDLADARLIVDTTKE